MSKEPTPIDYSTAAPELQRLAEEVSSTMQPRRIQRDGETIAVVMPVASKRRRPSPSPVSGSAAVTRLRAVYGTVTPRRRPEDFRALREEFELGMAEEVRSETP
jgi:hypothetical protein